MSAGRFAAISVLLMLAMAFAPMVADDSDAESTARMSDSRVLTATVKFIDGQVLRNDCVYFKVENAAGIAAMDALLKDHKGTVPKDDSGSLKDGDAIKIYYATKIDNIFGGFTIPIHVVNGTKIEDHSVLADLTSIVDSYSPGFFVKAGDEYTIRIVKAVDNYGKSVLCYYNDENGVYHDLSETYHGRMKKTTEFTFDTDSPSGADGRFYIDLVYESTGFSSPSGSATVFAALCAVVTVTIFCVLAYAGLKPKWSR